jgi:hypothetical protein
VRSEKNAHGRRPQKAFVISLITVHNGSLRVPLGLFDKSRHLEIEMRYLAYHIIPS